MTDDLNLAPTETVAWTGHPRLTAVLPAVGLGLVIVAVGIGFMVVGDGVAGLVGGLLLGSVGLAIPGWSYLRIVNTVFTLTDRSLYRRTGVLSRSVRQAELDRVQDSAFTQHARGRLFGYGTVTFALAGGSAIRFDRIDGPEAVRELVDRHRQRSDEIPGTHDQWRTIRDEVRALRRAIE